MDAPVLRLKMLVNAVKRSVDHEGNITQEELTLSAVYSNTPGSANSQWSKWTPYAELKMNVSNPDSIGKVLPGQFMFVDLALTDKDTL